MCNVVSVCAVFVRVCVCARAHVCVCVHACPRDEVVGDLCAMGVGDEWFQLCQEL